MENSKKTEFTVTLDGVQLPEDVHNKIRMEIQEVVMRNISKIDIQRKLPGGYNWPIIVPTWYGIIAVSRNDINEQIKDKNFEGIATLFGETEKIKNE